MSSKDSNVKLFKKFSEWSEVNAKEHTLPMYQFIFLILTYCTLGFAIGNATERIVVKLQGPLKHTIVDSALFAIVQIVLVSTVFFIGIKFYRHWDDWLWSTFAGMMFITTYVATQVRFTQNITELVK